MPEKFRFHLLFLVLLITTNLFSIEKLRTVSIISNSSKINLKENKLIVNHITDIIESEISQNYPQIEILYGKDKYNVDDIKSVSKYVIVNNQVGFLYLDSSDDASNITINVKSYSYSSEILFEDNYFIKIEKNNVDMFSRDNLAKLYKIINKSVEPFLLIKNNIKYNLNKNKLGQSSDLHFFSISLSALSLKFYIDGRTYLQFFSFYPIFLSLNFFPFKYFEVGSFISFDFNDACYKFQNINTLKFYYNRTFLNMEYGLFAGFSIFNSKYHFSSGLRFYNLFFNFPENSSISKLTKIRSSFLPQFSYYQKLDIKLFKSFYYSIYFNLKTIPLFILDNDNNFYSNQFVYDVILVEFSFLSFSYMF